MRMLEINQKKILHSKRILTDTGIEYFDTPVTLMVNPVVISSDWTPDLVGMVEKGTRIFSVDAFVYKNYFTIGDRFYVDVPLTEFNGSAEEADYVLQGIATSPNVVTITLQRLAV